jgi:lysophospholipase L1-like esterase
VSLGRAVALPLAPLLILQGRRVRRDTPKLPEADGERAGTLGASRRGRPLRLLIVGDSSAAGVGVGTLQQALTGQLLLRLDAALKGPLHWRLVARSGATTAEVLALLAGSPAGSSAGSPAERFDVAVVAAGVNDVTALRTAARWLADVEALTDHLVTRHRVTRVLWSGLPPMHRFPAMPQPLRAVMGLHARGLDAALVRWCRARAAGVSGRTAHRDGAAAPGISHAVSHVPLPPMTDASAVADDGFHPGPAAYAAWADTLVPHILAPRR